MKLTRILTAILLLLPLAACDINSSIDVPPDTEFSGGSTVNGSVTVGRNATVTGDLGTVNGTIRVAEGAKTGALSTVNGTVDVADNATIASAETVNGAITLENGVTVEEGLGTVNGAIVAGRGSKVGGDLEAVNGELELHGVTVQGAVSNVNGGMLITEGSHIAGDLVVERPSGSLEDKPPRIVIGPDSVVEGTLRFERPVRLYIHQSATVGPIRGAEAIRYAGEEPPED